MQGLVKRIKAFREPVTYASLRSFIRTIDFDQLDYQNEIPSPEVAGDYGRNILCLEPFECVLIHWPADVESGIHHHQGLFGYVQVLEGEIDNVVYVENGDRFEERKIQRYGEGGLVPEPDGVIHKIRNPRSDQRAITLHFYYPALTTLENMRLFNLEECAIGTLSAEAKTASWSEAPGHFKTLERDAFTFIPYDHYHKAKSHIISNVIPKPEAERIKEMNSAYFGEQAEQYDFYDFNLPKRKSYTERIDTLVADHLREHQDIRRVLDVACGTGRRAVHIREQSGLSYEIAGVDISEQMCELARERGIDAHHADWLEADHHDEEAFDAVTFLYAFGHIPTTDERKQTLQKIQRQLKPGGWLFVDLFNKANENEWGPQAVEAFEEQQLAKQGYEEGDVFYRKRGFEEIAFVHYFDADEVRDMLSDCGFEWIDTKIVGYSVKPGEILESEEEGNLFIIARKRG